MKLSGFLKVGFAGLALVAVAAFGLSSRGASTETLSPRVNQPRDIVQIDDVYYGIAGINGDFVLRSSTDLVAWPLVDTPEGVVEAVANLDGSLRVAVARSETDVFLFDLDAESNEWTEVGDGGAVIASEDLGDGATVDHVKIALDGVGVVASFRDAAISRSDVLMLATLSGSVTEFELPDPWNGRIGGYEEGFLIAPFGDASDTDLQIVSFDGDTTAVAAPPEPIVDIRILDSGELIGVNGLGSGDSRAVVASLPPYTEWVEIADAPEPASDACGSRFGASFDGELLLYYPYCNGHVWVAERGGDWVRSQNAGLGDADSVVSPVAVIDGEAILHTYKGTIGVDLPG